MPVVTLNCLILFTIITTLNKIDSKKSLLGVSMVCYGRSQYSGVNSVSRNLSLRFHNKFFFLSPAHSMATAKWLVKKIRYWKPSALHLRQFLHFSVQTFAFLLFNSFVSKTLQYLFSLWLLSISVFLSCALDEKILHSHSSLKFFLCFYSNFSFWIAAVVVCAFTLCVVLSDSHKRLCIIICLVKRVMPVSFNWVTYAINVTFSLCNFPVQLNNHFFGFFRDISSFRLHRTLPSVIYFLSSFFPSFLHFFYPFFLSIFHCLSIVILFQYWLSRHIPQTPHIDNRPQE